MYYICSFDYKGNVKTVEEVFKHETLPELQKNDFNAYFFSSQYGLGNNQYYIFIKLAKNTDMSLVAEIFYRSSIYKSDDKITETDFWFLKDIEQNGIFVKERGKTYHMECFSPTVYYKDLEKFFTESAFPYLRSVGFHVKLLKYVYKIGIPNYLFITEMENFQSIDQWPGMTYGDSVGKCIMEKMTSIITQPKAMILKEIE